MSSMICNNVFGKGAFELITVLFPQVRVPLNTARELQELPSYGDPNLLLSACLPEHGRIQHGFQNA